MKYFTELVLINTKIAITTKRLCAFRSQNLKDNDYLDHVPNFQPAENEFVWSTNYGFECYKEYNNLEDVNFLFYSFFMWWRGKVLNFMLNNCHDALNNCHDVHGSFFW